MSCPTLTTLLPLIVTLYSAVSAAAADYDVVVYGGTSGAITAAVQAKVMGKTVVVVSPDRHLGGLTSGGLGWTDTGNKAVIGGLARDFYHRIWQHYESEAGWRWQKKSEYGNTGQGTPAIDGNQRTMWIFEPSAAEKVFEDLVREHKIPVVRDEWLDRAKGVVKSGARITSITMLSGKTYTGRMFVDATYEGDLMAAAGVSYHVGREANRVYGEEHNGVQTGVLHHRHHFGVLKEKISPYVVPGDPKSGVLARVSSAPPGVFGEGDSRVQAYCYRMCLTDVPENRVPFAKPAGYDPKQYELLARIYAAGWTETFGKFDPIPNHKTDTNNHGPFSTDNIGMSYDYPEASYTRRREILKEHENYQKGWLYFITTDPRVPKEAQEKMRKWGLPKDEFKDNGNWPHQIYVREARRMIGSYVMTENELRKKRPTPDSVGMGSYTIDSHNVQRYITPDGSVQNEGDIGVPTGGPYEIAYGSLVPKRGQADNLLVPVCLSSSHIAFGSIRMEPVFMILGQSAATAAVLAIDAKISVQDVPYAKLKERLLKDGQVLSYSAPAPLTATLPESVRRVVFLGDSITYSGGYVADVAAYFATRHPGRKIEFINVGLSSETVSGLSEEGHAGGKFPRPDLHERLGRVLAQTKPDLVFACYGMNDGIYLPLDEGRFQKYRDGITWLHDQVVAAGARIIHATPAPYDENRGKKEGYAAVLDRYAEWLLAQRKAAQWDVVDLHFPMQRFAVEQQKVVPSFTLSKDGVHPDELGHWLMAREILLHLGARDLGVASNAAEMVGAHSQGATVLSLVGQRHTLMRDAWLTATGHKRPGVKAGKPLVEAEALAGDIDAQLALLK